MYSTLHYGRAPAPDPDRFAGESFVPGTVLTPLDGSRFAEFVLPCAAAIADRARWSFHLVHAHVPDPKKRGAGLPALPPSVRPEETGCQRVLHARQSYLTSVVRRFRLEVDSASALMAEEGIPGTIRRHAETLGTDLIVMSTHGRTGLHRLWLGSVADSLVRSTRIPVLLVRPERTSRSPARLAEIDRVLVPLDTAGVGERILAPVMELGQALGWRFLLLHVVPTQLLVGARPYPIHAHDLEQGRRRGREYLHGVAARFRRRGLTVDVRVVEDSAPDRAILRTVEGEDVDLVAMASHGRGGVTRAILGSVTDRVLSGTSRPVLLGGCGETAVH